MDEATKTKEFWSDKAKEIWAEMTRNEQFGVRFGMAHRVRLALYPAIL